MKKYLLIIVLLSYLPFVKVYTQDVLFSYDINNGNPTTSVVNVYAQFDGSGNSNAAGYTVVFYYDAAEATTATGNVDFTPTTNLGWVTSGNTTYSNFPQNNPNVPITHTNRIEIGVLDGNFVGTDFPSTPSLLLTITFNKDIGTPQQGGEVYIGATADTDGAIVYFDNSFTGYPVQITGEREGLLPVHLISFSAEKFSERHSLLKWSTSSEINSSHFNIQRSFDKTTWTNVGKVEAKGFSQIIQNYEFVDENVYNGKDARLTAYYRLQAVDFDNTAMTSPMRSVVFTSSSSITSREILAYPNPSSQGIQIEWSSELPDQPTKLEFYDLKGKLVYSADVAENTYQEYIDFSRTSIIPGLYLLRILSNDQTIDHKQIVVDRR